MSIDPSRPLPLPAICDAPGRLDHTLICFNGDVVFLQTTGQCAGAFVEVSMARVRLNRDGSGTCRPLFRSFWKVIFLIRWVLDILCRTFCLFWSWSFPTACQRVGHRNTSKALGLNLIVVRLAKTVSGSLLHSGRFPAHVVPQQSSSDKCNKETDDVGCNESTCLTTTRRLLQSDVVRSCTP